MFKNCSDLDNLDFGIYHALDTSVRDVHSGEIDRVTNTQTDKEINHRSTLVGQTIYYQCRSHIYRFYCTKRITYLAQVFALNLWNELILLSYKSNVLLFHWRSHMVAPSLSGLKYPLKGVESSCLGCLRVQKGVKGCRRAQKGVESICFKVFNFFNL